MKTTGKFLLFISLILFVSCSSDDNGGDDNGNDNTSSINNPLVDIGKQLLVSVGESGGEQLSYKYDEKLRPYFCCLENSSGRQSDVFTIDFDKGTIFMWEEFGDWSISFIKSGYIDRIKGSWEFTEGNNIYSGLIDLSCSYDNAGHLLGVDLTEENHGDPNESYKKTCKVTLVWNNGNLASIEQRDVWTDDGGSTSTLIWTRNFEYGDQPNKYRQYIGFLSCDGNDSPFFAAGLMGIGSERLPTSVTDVEKHERDGYIRDFKYVETATFTLNDNGSINTETWTEDNRSRKYIYSYTPVSSYTSSFLPKEISWPSSQTRASSMTKSKCIKRLLSILPFVSRPTNKQK